ncbi:MFS transporter [Pseudomonas oryzihabitans]|uniref:MFS transporter n=1 Tax=Pseudomonas oryzihabitans TaxID=47885 RepID=UPI000ECE9A0A|nr:MFS transporter [Pseudomonas oryzihabitans]HCV75149.1 MFS transporter [Pseudomonas sp.]
MAGQGRGLVLVMLFLAGVVNYLDRSALSVAAPLIQKDFALSAGEMGLLFSAFFVGYAAFNFIGGWAADRYGAKTTLLLAMVLWSAFSGLTVLASGFAALIVIRVLFGMAEGPLSVSTSKMVNNWYAPHNRGRTLGLSMSGTPLGGAISGPIVGVIAVAYGWKVSFVVIMLIGFVWAVVWYLWIKDKPSGQLAADIAAEERAVAVVDTEVRPLKYYLRQPTVLFTALAFFAYNYTLFFFLTWFPSYLIQAYGLNVKDMSIATVIPWVLGFIGLAVGGYLSDWVFRKTGRLMFSRKVVLVTCLLACALCIAVAGLVSTLYAAVALVALSVFFLYLTGAIYWAIIQDTVPAARVGGVSGFMHFLANTSGIIGPAVTGYLVQFTGAFTSAFLLAGALTVIGSLCVARFVKPLAERPADAPAALATGGAR